MTWIVRNLPWTRVAAALAGGALSYPLLGSGWWQGAAGGLVGAVLAGTACAVWAIHWNYRWRGVLVWLRARSTFNGATARGWQHVVVRPAVVIARHDAVADGAVL